jgi:hypothetical protein
MGSEKHVTTRELLRNFRTLRDLLLEGKLRQVVVDLDDERELELSVRDGSGTGTQIAQIIRNLPRPIHVRRSEVFSSLFR